MAGPLLETKLHVPRSRRTLVPRPRLAARLERASEATLTLVSAPAGFGKTTLVADWAAARDGATAWLSLDARDDDPTAFWTYVVAALRTVAPEVGDEALARLTAPRAPVQEALESLLNDLAATPHDVVLVLDDVHLVASRAVHDGLAFLLDHLPQHVHVVLATRADPPLPVARLRARGELVEVRAVDLRFTPDESTAYLTGVMGLPLTAPDVEALDDRTEGWIAALQLAALSMQGRDDVAGFIAGFRGDDRYVVDYLVEEVLQRQPVPVRQFLLETSVLSRLTGPLCDAVTGRDDGRAVLEALERGNLLVVPLDDARRWYRYHHLFADVLRAHLHSEHPERVAGLHQRASAWFEQDGDDADAVAHALAGDDPERAAALVERALPRLRRERQDATLRRWLDALPAGTVHASPALSVAAAGALLVHGEVDGVEDHLRAAEQALGATADGPERRALERAVAMYRAGHARITGDAEATVRHARRLLELTGEDDHVDRGAGSALLGLALWETGELAAAADCYAESVRSFRRAGFVADVLGCTVKHADIERARGRLDAATAALEAGLRAAAEAPGVPRGTADLHVALAELLLDRGDVVAAAEHLARADALGDAAGLPQRPYRSRVAAARVRWHAGDVDEALALLDEAERLHDTDFSPDARPVRAVRARLLAAAGRAEQALACLRDLPDALAYVREQEHLALARVLVATGSREAGGLLDRLLAAATDGDRATSVVDVLVLQAVAGTGSVVRAVEAAEALRYAAPLLEDPVALEAARRAVPGSPLLGGRPALPVQPGLVEPLSPRELDVLRLLTSDLDGPEIARHLFVSVNTLRTHTKRIYAKLGVTSRRAAVARARALALV